MKKQTKEVSQQFTMKLYPNDYKVLFAAQKRILKKDIKRVSIAELMRRAVHESYGV